MHFLGSRRDVPQILSALDVFTLTSHNEASPVSILEALACEVPVVATRVGAVSETVIEGETGWLADPGDAAALARHWVALLNNRSLARQFGAAGRQHVLARSSLQTMVEGYQELIAAVYDGKAGERPESGDRRPEGGVERLVVRTL